MNKTSHKKFTASSPGKFILMGEHAVVYGKPAVALAINKRLTCTISESTKLTINGLCVAPDDNSYVSRILSANNLTTASISIKSELLPGSGLGSSGALCTSLLTSIKRMLGKSHNRKDIASEAFEAEYRAQGRASPVDTSCCTFGNGIAVNCPKNLGQYLWTASKNGDTWDIFNIPIPKMTFVVGYTGIRSLTASIVEKVKKYKEQSPVAENLIDEIGNVTIDGMQALSKNDTEHLGRLMTKNHKLLASLGVSCRELDKLVNASLEYSYGAKLTGSGGGGSMIALTDEPGKVCQTISLHGGFPFIVSTSVEGTNVETGDLISN
ncbi:MAG: mevalonate kinase [archaeon]|nr:mevalonate kinase [archaeon]